MVLEVVGVVELTGVDELTGAEVDESVVTVPEPMLVVRLPLSM